MDPNESLKLGSPFFDIRLFEVGDTPVTLATVIILALIIAASMVVSRLLQRATVTALKLRGVSDEGTIGVTRKLLHYSVMTIGFGIGLQTIGINLSTLFTAGAIFAIGLGFAMQNIIQNFVAGVVLLLERTIKPGDVLQVEGRVVRVGRMGIRATIARTLDDEEIIVPNSAIVQSTVTNYTLRDSIYRVRCSVGVTYGSDMNSVKNTLEKAAVDLPWRYQGQTPVVLLTDFGDSSVNFEVSVWMEDPWRARRAKSDLNEAIWWALKDAGITIAFPQLDVHFDPPVTDSLERLPLAQ